MARYRGLEPDTHLMRSAVRNEGLWPPVLAFLDETKLSRIPIFGHPPVTREADGVLIIWDTREPVPVGDWLVMTPGGALYAMPDEGFTNLFEPIKEDEK